MKEFCALCVAWLVACLSTFGSLYFSEGLNLDTCNLCWIQRMCTYPLVIILGMAVYNCCYTVIPYVIPQLCIGCLAAVYQVAVQASPTLDVFSFCQTYNCLERTDIGMGTFTLPMLSACACACMIGCLYFAWRQSQQDETQFVSIKIK